MVDVAVVGAGAAGLAAGIFLRRLNPALSVVAIDSARVPGAKILVSGGSRCNVTNRVVTDADFWGAPRPLVRRVLRGLSVRDTVQFFAQMGVALHEEADGKLFPDSNRARDVRDALVAELARVGTRLLTATRVADVERNAHGFRLVVNGPEPVEARAVVLATGGLSLPKTGSDGTGLEIARRLGHSVVPTTPALVPLALEDRADAMHRDLTGIAHDAELCLWVDGRANLRLRGSLLWTHFGISGPVALDMSRHWLRARLNGQAARLTLSFHPGGTFEHVDDAWSRLASERPKASVQAVLAQHVPAAVAACMIARLDIDPAVVLAHFDRGARRRLARGLVEWPLPVVGCRGYNYAEVTAGGVPLEQVDTASMQSRICPGLFLVGEILDVDGRIGGFNFQWAWSSAYVAARALTHL
ncbi:MAG: NAD(P)/FAD-dependent oxidoreductase [Bacteroidales bacterium]